MILFRGEYKILFSIHVLHKDESFYEAKIDKTEASINNFNLKVDWQCLPYFSSTIPCGFTDLRFVVAVLRANTDLERIGDRVQSLAQTYT